jgi:hypothetical protein
MALFPSVQIISVDPEAVASLTGRGYPVRTESDTVDPSVDVLIAADAAVDDAVLDAVRGGLGLVVLGADVDLPEAGLTGARESRPGAVVAAREETATITTEDLLARVDTDMLRAAGTLSLSAPAAAVLRAGGASVAAVTELGSGRVVVLAVEPIAGGNTSELLFNAVNYAARPAVRAEQAIHPLVADPTWQELKQAVVELRPLQLKDGSIQANHPETAVAQHAKAAALIERITASIAALAPQFPHDADYLAVLVKDFTRWAEGGFEVPDFLDSLVAFQPAVDRADGRTHLVVFPMYTQNGNLDRNVEAVLLQMIWPDFIAELEAGDYSNKLFLPIRFLDFTPGYDTNSAVLFPETIAMRELPKFTWGGIFADREAARFRRVVSSAAEVTSLQLPPDAARLLADQQLAEQTFVMWDMIHDRTHMHGDLPFDPFMIKQRMPFFLYSLEEMRCDLTAFRESVELEKQGNPHARLVQYAMIFDRIFRFAITGNRVRNYDGLGGQLLFAWLHQHGVLHWTDTRLSIDWQRVTEPVLELGRQIEDLYWKSIDRPKIAHWLAGYQLVSSVLTPHPLSDWARYTAGDRDALPLDGPPKGITDRVLDDEFPLSMFYEALNKKMKDVVGSTAGITG